MQVDFINFEDILEKDVLKNLDVIINCGSAGTSWSGGSNWANPSILTALREFVYAGGGFIGINEPSTYEYQGAYFQLDDILGVQKETGKTTLMKYWDMNSNGKHFIVNDMQVLLALIWKRHMFILVDPILKCYWQIQGMFKLQVIFLVQAVLSISQRYHITQSMLGCYFVHYFGYQRKRNLTIAICI